MSTSSAPSRWVRQAGVLLLLLGIDPRKMRSVRNLPRFLKDRAAFRAAGGRIDYALPVLADYDDQAGSARGHYFHQDLLVATLIHQAAPRRHIDVASRVDGFVAHVAAFRPIEIMDIRPLQLEHARISYIQNDITVANPATHGITDSLSCLHALEHFGLGRYGDPIDPDGYRRGFENLHSMVEPGGTFYLGVPISGSRSGVYFNAHRVFRPTEPLDWAAGVLELIRFDYVDDDGRLHMQQSPHTAPDLAYGCGIYTFRKLA